jgi:hypothetical protein
MSALVGLTNAHRIMELQPEHSIAWIERNIPYTPAPMVKFLEGMRKAGLK